MNRMKFLVGLLSICYLTAYPQILCCPPVEPPSSFPFWEGASWPTWGADMRRSHFQPNAAGPNNPTMMWTYLNGGAINEPVVDDFNTLWIPQTRQYLFLDGPSGENLGAFGPMQGNSSSALFINAAVIVVDQEEMKIGTGSCIGLPDYVPLFLLSGGQSDFWLYTVDPFTGFGVLLFSEPLILFNLEEIPVENFHQYQTNSFAAVTLDSIAFPVNSSYYETLTAIEENGYDGAYSMGIWSAYFWDGATMIPALWTVTANWVVQVQTEVDEDAGTCEITDITNYNLFYDIEPYELPGVSYAPFSTASSGFIGMGFHNGLLMGLPEGLAGFPWFADIGTLSDQEVASDTFDRPLTVTSDESLAIVCGVKSGRIYGVETASGDAQWEFELNTGVIGGPSIGPDPANGNEDTVYLVTTRHVSMLSEPRPANSSGSSRWRAEAPAARRLIRMGSFTSAIVKAISMRSIPTARSSGAWRSIMRSGRLRFWMQTECSTWQARTATSLGSASKETNQAITAITAVPVAVCNLLQGDSEPLCLESPCGSASWTFKTGRNLACRCEDRFLEDIL